MCAQASCAQLRSPLRLADKVFSLFLGFLQWGGHRMWDLDSGDPDFLLALPLVAVG